MAGLAHCLANAGLTGQSAGAAAYSVTVTASRRPGAATVTDAGRDALPALTPPPANTRPWPARATIESLGLTIGAMADGHELYRAGVSRIVAKPGHGAATPLADMLCGLIAAK